MVEKVGQIIRILQRHEGHVATENIDHVSGDDITDHPEVWFTAGRYGEDRVHTDKMATSRMISQRAGVVCRGADGYDEADGVASILATEAKTSTDTSSHR